MLGDLVKRAVNLVVLALAAVTFFCVPFGSKTLFRHLCAIFSTPEAAELGREIREKSGEVVDEVKALADAGAKPQAEAPPDAAR